MRRERLTVLALAATTALLLALAVGSAWQGAMGLAGRGRELTAIAEAAGAFVAAEGTALPDDSSSRARLADLTTGSLRAALAAAPEDPAARPWQRTAHTRVRSVRVTARSGAAAIALVVADQDRRGTDPVTGAVHAGRVRRQVVCRLVLEDAVWRVSAYRVTDETPAPLPAGSERG